MKSELRLTIDIVTVLLLAVFVLYFYVSGVPTRRGFYCDDQSIQYPYVPSSTVPSWALFLVGAALNLITTLTVEYFQWRHVGDVTSQSRDQTVMLCGRRVPPLLVRVYRVYGVFTLGCVICLVLTDIGKYSVGRLRPHFMAVCQPDMNSLNCSSHAYVHNYKCLGDDEDAIRQARLSFPSGHSSFAFYTSVFLLVYIHLSGGRLVRRCGSLTLLVQVALVSAAWFTALSRVTDYKHHATDVVAGSALGAILAVAMIVYLYGFYGHWILKYPSYVVAARRPQQEVATESAQIQDKSHQTSAV